MNTIKTLLAASALILSTQAFALDEQMCLALGDIGRVTANARSTGLARADLIANLPLPKHDGSARGLKIAHKIEKQRNMVINYVYTMQLGEADASKLVYLKCRAGEYDNM